MSPVARLLLLSLLASACGCKSNAAGGEVSSPKSAAAAPATAPLQPTVILSPPGRDPVTVKVEVAKTEEERRRGLMFRKHLDADAGMLFLFDRPAQQTFWMRNTYVPLDMIFIESDLRVLGVVENAEPLTDDGRATPGSSQYVLEVNAGFSRRYGLGAGTAVRFDGIEVGNHGN